MQAGTPSCYGSMVASTSEDSPPSTQTLQSSSSRQFIEAPAFFYDMDTDLKDLKTALKGADLLNDSGYQSVLERSRHPFATSLVLNDDNSFDSDDDSADEHWDGYLTVGSDRVKIKDMSDILATRYAFLSGQSIHQPLKIVSGWKYESLVVVARLLKRFYRYENYAMPTASSARTNEGLTIVTFPDSRSTLSFEDYSLLVTYLLQSFFPGQVRVVFLLKPEGVLQRALEVGYRGIAETCSFKVVQLDSSIELRKYLRAEQLTMDVGGLIKYNHLEWVQHRMDIERMKSSATAIAASLSDFGRTLRETELPNDVETTARILEAQTAEKDAIKEDFRISVRKGMSLLRSVRQMDMKPTPEQLSPTRLHNVTAIERMLVQLEETEKSFDLFWAKHEKRLSNCLQLRQFEESFRKLQSAFARHMLYLEEHREVGDGREKALQLADQHRLYAEQAMDSVKSARALRVTGEELISGNDIELSGSLLPKCEELERMADALTGALERRTAVLRMSSVMHEQIAQANSWCKKGVEILTSVPFDMSGVNAGSAVAKMDEFLSEGSHLQLDSLGNAPSLNSLILLTTTETSTLLAQVAERIDDIRRMSVARRDALAKISEQKKPPVQVVTPEKKKKNRKERSSARIDVSVSSRRERRGRTPLAAAAVKQSSLRCLLPYQNLSARSLPRFLSFRRSKRRLVNSISAPLIGIDPHSRDIDVKDVQSCSGESPTDSNPRDTHTVSMESRVIAELLTTERSYVTELESLVEYYVEPFESSEYQSSIAIQIRGRSDLVFGNLRDLLAFHSCYVCPDLQNNECSLSGICRTFLQHHNKFLGLYRVYCQNKSTSEAIRKDFGDNSSFFVDCQKKANHPLPLSAYLLKPVQRITKYQLLLKELEKYCQPEVRHEVTAALSSMLDLLAQINAAVQQLHISGFNGDLRLLGPLRLQSECDVYSYNKKKKGKLSRAQRRHLFLFDGGALFCKKRTPPSNQPSSMDPEYYEHKICIPTSSLGFADSSRSGINRFELWDEAKTDAYVIEPLEASLRERWIERLGKNCLQDGYVLENRQRPKSWASTMSNESSCSTSTRESDSGDSQMDTNGNTQSVGPGPYSPIESPLLDVTSLMETVPVLPTEDPQGEELVDSC
ncbi:unnamed protein product [Caenorhabditis auriculariae]|uniref:DH domain-containing protein n=1 Tax=Caenorhabditis auriculariae TaxID=2777116 RepID=A0A8S1GNJ3_9PELO|nr:unnamed protein product [Caenorhabditis auriculariae]